jgi:hypothetical protein
VALGAAGRRSEAHRRAVRLPVMADSCLHGPGRRTQKGHLCVEMASLLEQARPEDRAPRGSAAYLQVTDAGIEQADGFTG